ncbi:reverse transcriptase [Teladorsagia circumcincta]|uniref:RNA-directed DNA polymerase n=1 Tax=Teladorsagia circumcincta TaxID=45464 RepID=A0A2G9V1H0_TELCI|nr:reverse transcriptase [Teladorsagia circumcincta]
MEKLAEILSLMQSQVDHQEKKLEYLQKQQKETADSFLRALKKMEMRMTTANTAAAKHIIFDSLCRRIDKFNFDAENGRTFDIWYKRFKDVFDNDCAELNEQEKTRLLCLIYVAGFQGAEFADYRTRLLRKLDQGENITIKDLTAECQLMKSYKEDARMLETAVNANVTINHVNKRRKRRNFEQKQEQKNKRTNVLHGSARSGIQESASPLRQQTRRYGTKSYQIKSIEAALRKHNQPHLEVEVNEHPIDLLLDTGAMITLISKSSWKILGRLQPRNCNTVINAANGTRTPTNGSLMVDFVLSSSDGKQHGGRGCCYVTNNLDIFGWGSRRFQSWWNPCKDMSVIDFADAYLQVEVDDEAKELLTIKTHRGLLRYNRLPFGVKSAPGIFQQIIDSMTCGLEGCAAYLNDVIVTGRNIEEHVANLETLFKRISDYGFRVRIEKCNFLMPQLRYLGNIIDATGRRPDPAKIEVIRKMPHPDIVQVRSFLGMLNYYGHFISKMRQLRAPLDDLLKKNVPFEWSPECQDAFQRAKDVLASDLLLTHYDPTKEIVIAADASEYGIGAVIVTASRMERRKQSTMPAVH